MDQFLTLQHIYMCFVFNHNNNKNSNSNFAIDPESSSNAILFKNMVHAASARIRFGPGSVCASNGSSGKLFFLHLQLTVPASAEGDACRQGLSYMSLVELQSTPSGRHSLLRGVKCSLIFFCVSTTDFTLVPVC